MCAEVGKPGGTGRTETAGAAPRPRRERVPRAVWKASAKARRRENPSEPFRSCLVCRARRPWSELILINPFVMRVPGPEAPPACAAPVSTPPPPAAGSASPAPEAAAPPVAGSHSLPSRGRGAWVCRNEACLARLRRKGALDRAFRGQRELAPGALEALMALASGPAGGLKPPPAT
ncbi:MAG: YlxR family protein [Deltaproteobacteria bacterium]|nr:YlxR family protein [Deltaproteobacteria bacterium]